MTSLRKHLEAEKERHSSFVYPGNLAAEILGATKVNKASVMDYADAGLRRRPWLLRWVVGLGAVSAAAALLLFLYVHRQPVGPGFSEQTVAVNSPDEDEIPLALTSSVSIPEDVPVTLTSAVSIAPDTSSMSLSSIPSFSDLSSSDQTAN
jgi:hypothetical protein